MERALGGYSLLPKWTFHGVTLPAQGTQRPLDFEKSMFRVQTGVRIGLEILFELGGVHGTGTGFEMGHMIDLVANRQQGREIVVRRNTSRSVPRDNRIALAVVNRAEGLAADFVAAAHEQIIAHRMRLAVDLDGGRGQ